MEKNTTLPAMKTTRSLPLGRGILWLPMLAGEELIEIVDQMPFDGDEAVQQPEVNALKAMEPEAGLLGESRPRKPRLISSSWPSMLG